MSRLLLFFALAAPNIMMLSACATEEKPAIKLGLVQPATAPKTAPEFSKIKNSKERKKKFFRYFRVLVENENRNIETTRKELAKLFELVQEEKKLTAAQSVRIKNLARRYRVKRKLETAETIEQLQKKIDVLPIDLVLIQAANESAWGTSRFAKTGNNYFGQWCYKPGCGIVPKRRTKGSKHEVAAYKSPLQSVQAYMHNINSHPAYEDLREIRINIRKQNHVATGRELAEGLLKYSERGANYVRDIQKMIQANQSLIFAIK